MCNGELCIYEYKECYYGEEMYTEDPQVVKGKE